MMSPNQTRRRALLAAAALASLSPAAPAWAQALKQTAKAAGPARIVIVGAGVGGASTAKYLKLFSPGLDVTLIDRNPNYVRHYGSSEVVVGTKTIEDMTVSYNALKSKYGVKVVQDTVTGLDPDRKEVVGEAGRYPTTSSWWRRAWSFSTTPCPGIPRSSPRRRFLRVGSRGRRRCFWQSNCRRCPRAGPS